MAKVTDAGKVGFSPDRLPQICQLLRKMLLIRANGSGVGYDPEMDALYRSVRGGFLLEIGRQTRLRSLAKSAALALPDSLAELPYNLSWSQWRTMQDLGDDALVRFQGNLLSAVMAAGIQPVWDRVPSSDGEGSVAMVGGATPEATSPSSVETAPALRRDQERAAKRKHETWRLRDEGLTVKEIARQLSCSPSTVTNDLKGRP